MNIRMTIPKKRDNSGTAVLYIVRPDFVGPTAPAHRRRRASTQAVANRAQRTRPVCEPDAGQTNDDEPIPNAAQYCTTGDSARPECERSPRDAVRCSRMLYRRSSLPTLGRELAEAIGLDDTLAHVSLLGDSRDV